MQRMYKTIAFCTLLCVAYWTLKHQTRGPTDALNTGCQYRKRTVCPRGSTTAECRCNTNTPPGGLRPDQIPLFITITHDDEVDHLTMPKVASFVDSLIQPNGCPVPVTWFAQINGTDCDRVQQRWARGDEIAAHTVMHKELNTSLHPAEVDVEILGSRAYLVFECGIPKEDVVGWRSPYLTTNPISRRLVYKAGYLYESSVLYAPKKPEQLIFPFTLHAGMPEQFCDPVWRPCEGNESYPGLWEIPIWSLEYDGQQYAMDPSADSEGNGEVRPVFDVLKANLEQTYNLNRVHLPIYVHAAWFEPERIKEAQRFVEYATGLPDVYFVTMRQLIEWTRNPVPKDKVSDWLKSQCGSKGRWLNRLLYHGEPITAGKGARMSHVDRFTVIFVGFFFLAVVGTWHGGLKLVHKRRSFAQMKKLGDV